jgi:hypothetical protein
MIRMSISVLCFLATFLSLLQAGTLETKNVVLVTLDGVRWQEFFTGADEKLLDPDRDADLIKQVIRETPEERRLSLMPFFWGSLAPQGMVLHRTSEKSRIRKLYFRTRQRRHC